MVEIGFAWVEPNTDRKVSVSILEATDFVQGDSFVVVGERVFMFQLDSSVVIMDREVKLVDFVVGERPIEVTLEVFRVRLDGLGVSADSLLVSALFASQVALLVQPNRISA